MLARTLPLALGLAWALSALPATAASTSIQAQFGAATYQFYCETCHGAGGKGDGPAAASLSTKPADLTALARNNGGAFPTDRVTAAIDGRVEIVGHLDLAMPPWAALFAHEFESFAKGTVVDALIERRIAHIVAYIETLQAE